MISDLGGLQVALTAWVNRPDLPSFDVGEIIALAEERIYRDVRCRQMVTTTTLQTVAGVDTVALPDRWIEGISLRIDNPRMPLAYLTPEALRSEYSSTYTGLPSAYTIEGSNIVLGPTPGQVYDIQVTYYQRFDPLETTNTNALLSLAPSLYLFGALSEAAPYLMDDPRVPLWESKYAAAVRQVNTTQSSAATAGTSMRIRSR